MRRRREAMSVQRPPRMRPTTVAAGAGALWGAFCYSVLWNGAPFEVDRRFFESVAGSLVLLPARLVLWTIHATEVVAGRTFDLSASTWIPALGTVAAGTVLGVLIVFAARGAETLVRR